MLTVFPNGQKWCASKTCIAFPYHLDDVSQLPRWPSSIYRIQWWGGVMYSHMCGDGEHTSHMSGCIAKTHACIMLWSNFFNIAATASPCLRYRLDGKTALLYDRESICRCWVRRREGLSITFLPEGLWSFNIETSWFKCKYKHDHVLHINVKFPSVHT